MTEAEVIFDIKKVTKKFQIKKQSIQALEEVNVQIMKNQFVALLGTSGCGKSTLLRMLCGLDSPTTGKILFKGNPIFGPDVTRGMIFQGCTLFPWMTIIENVAYGLKEGGKPKTERLELALKYIDDIGLTGFEKVYPKELSGGMRQRVALARALANNPDVLLMDEPFGALDAQTRGNMQDLTLQLWEKYPKTVVMVTHDVEEAVLMADSVIVMNAHPGSVKEIIDIDIPRPRNAKVKRTPGFIGIKRHATQLILEESIKNDMVIHE